MAYMCILAPSQECDGCEACKEDMTDKEYMRRWVKMEEEYDNYREEEYMKEAERNGYF